MPIQEIGLAVSLFAGALFLLTALRRHPDRPDAPASPEAGIYWPLLLGTGQRKFDRTMRLAIVRQLATADKDWRLPILLCAREQETDPEMLAAVDHALGDAVKPVIGSPPA
ncbi:MAG TPA: hypothetical protein VIG46_02170 [Candidatus Baltobacteraceae bacterium]|jgi:hypothetical protein